MNKKPFRNYYLFSIAAVLLESIYPLYMGIRVVSDMLTQGTVLGADYPKYIIPYTPISIAVISGVLLMPILIKHAGRFALLAASCISTGIFFLSELLFENKLIVTVTLQFAHNFKNSRYVPYELFKTRRWHVTDVLIGEYGPLFKIYFYIFSVVLILSFLRCFYGFGQMIRSNNKNRLKILILLTISSVLFLRLFIFACHTGFFQTITATIRNQVELESILAYFTTIFFRKKYLIVPLVSAILISIFFIMFCVTAGLLAVSFFAERKKRVSFAVVSGVSMAAILTIYLGEILFAKAAEIELVPVDILLIVLLGCIAGCIAGILERIANNKK